MFDGHSPTLLSVRELTYRYGERVAVQGIDFQIRQGEFFGLLGPNGAGKTTTISCIAGLLNDWKGNMEFEGRPFAPSRILNDRAQIGFVPQELAIYEQLTALENLTLFAKLAGLRGSDAKDRIHQQLEIAGLVERQRDLVKTYSGGMKRRLNLACGLLHNPKLILLDEPTVGIDPQSRNHIFESFVRLQESGATILYTTHYMEEAERLCDRIAIMNEGKVMAIGDTAELAATAGRTGADLETVFLQMTGRSLRDS